jgi:hypothetical protein
VRPTAAERAAARDRFLRCLVPTPMNLMPTPPESLESPMPLLLAADLQDQLMTAGNDLDRLQRLLAASCDTLMACFHGALHRLDTLQRGATGDGAAGLRDVQHALAEAVTALQFQDMASQLITHTHQRLRNCADQLARDAFGPDADGDAVVAPPPLRPNPVTQDEMDAGSVELF